MRIPTNALFTTDLTPLFPRENFFRIDFFGLVELELLLLLSTRGGGVVEVEGWLYRPWTIVVNLPILSIPLLI